MMKWLSAVVLTTIVTVVGPGRIEAVAAASSLQSSGVVSASSPSAAPTDISAHRHAHRHHRYYRYGYRPYGHGYRPYGYGYRPHYPRYYARPYYYEPYPYYAPAPFPFGFSFGFGPGWW
jgi:hypothetical protein